MKPLAYSATLEGLSQLYGNCLRPWMVFIREKIQSTTLVLGLKYHTEE